MSAASARFGHVVQTPVQTRRRAGIGARLGTGGVGRRVG